MNQVGERTWEGSISRPSPGRFLDRSFGNTAGEGAGRAYPQRHGLGTVPPVSVLGR